MRPNPTSLWITEDALNSWSQTIHCKFTLLFHLEPGGYKSVASQGLESDVFVFEQRNTPLFKLSVHVCVLNYFNV